MTDRTALNAPILELPHTSWDFEAPETSEIIDTLEAGNVLFFPNLNFNLTEAEAALLGPELVDPKRKNISFNVEKDQLRGVVDPANEPVIKALLERYYASTKALVETLLPNYKGHLIEPVNSLRVHEIAKWQDTNSWRKDDTRLHVDAFPSRPIHGNRILRIFNNINPHGVPRSWRVGESFETLAERVLPGLKPYSPMASWIQDKLHITKSRRTHYDHLMLAMHDAMKADLEYQKNGVQWDVDFFPGATWVCYADQVPHAAMSGQYMLEQTYLIDVNGLKNPELAPLKILERLTGEALL